jgi:hypothetical protein
MRYDTARPGFAESLWRDDRARNKARGPFVFKSDIDSAPIEKPIVASLLEDNAQNCGAIGSMDKLIYIPIEIASFIDIAGKPC